MDLSSFDLLPIPPALADLPVHDIAPFGPLVAGADVARAFQIKVSTLRTWRDRGRFPQPAHPTPTASYYRVADLVSEYYRRFPGALPDRPEDALGRFYAVALDRAPETAEAERGAAADVSKAVPSRLIKSARAVTLSDAFRQQQLAVFREAVSELLVREPEPPAVIEALAAEMTAQRRALDEKDEEIARLRAELVEARVREAEALQWRDKPVLDRLLGR